jgi:hypothetical protein
MARGIHIGKLSNGVMVDGTTYRAKYDLESRHIRYIAPLYEVDDLEFYDLNEKREPSIPKEERESLKVGAECDLWYTQIQPNGVWETNRLMVIVKQINVNNEVGHYMGQLEQPPIQLSGIVPGDWIEFSACHIVNIHHDFPEANKDEEDEEDE